MSLTFVPSLPATLMDFDVPITAPGVIIASKTAVNSVQTRFNIAIKVPFPVVDSASVVAPIVLISPSLEAMNT